MRNLTMMTDLYQFTMMYGYYKTGKAEDEAVFDMFFRRLDEQNSTYAIVAGLEQVVEYIKNIHFEEADLQYLRDLNLFNEGFLQNLANMRFTGELYAMPEGSIAFANEPILRVKAPIFEAQFVETTLLNIINHQTLIATKACKVVQAAGDGVLEFGLRRAHGPDAGIYGARAAMIGGCSGTSNVLTGELFGLPAKGTHAHSWVMSFADELEAFRAYAENFPTACLLLVDTYDTLRSGMPNAIKVFDELRAKGYEPLGIRLDSGDLAYLSKEARRMMDEAGYPNAKVFASGDLDEVTILDLKQQGACIDQWGVGTRLITSDDCPALGGVYKLARLKVDGELQPCLKISDNAKKLTLPGYKKVVRIYSKKTHKALADLIMLDEEVIDENQPLTIFDPLETWKQTTITDFYTKNLLEPVFVNGECVYQAPKLLDIQAYAKAQLDTFWKEYKRFRKPQHYKVDLSDKLFALRKNLLAQHPKKDETPQ